MTVDEFTKTFKKCPVCKSPVVYDTTFPVATEISGFYCEGYDECFVGFPALENIKEMGIIYLYLKDRLYTYSDRLYVYTQTDSDDNWSQDNLLGSVECDDSLAIQLFKKPKSIEKYLILG